MPASTRRRVGGAVHLRHNRPQVAVQVVGVRLAAAHQDAARRQGRSTGGSCCLLPLAGRKVGVEIATKRCFLACGGLLRLLLSWAVVRCGRIHRLRCNVLCGWRAGGGKAVIR